eukprot:NODE_2713_length_1357_cov_112.500810_g2577_i0.p1 GENE.NODE_2713_length_1357_cov_112.500810_g2577_i0~~NODE_2713_length_1357_cov_112.500810_g2577_i0.p1  ORF type:complete len:373 (-),score=48.39 NODE_2713_length_1357_cov_112.500810_g2577_i0:184-1302(-)
MAAYGYDQAEYDRALAELESHVRPHLPHLPLYDTAYVARFLRARKLDVQKAQDMLLASLEWRKENNADNILDGPPPDERIVRYLPHGFMGVSKINSLVYYERTGNSRLDLLLPQISPEAMMHWKVWLQEHGERLGRQIPGKKAERDIAVMDMDGLSLMRVTKQVLDFYQMVGAVDEANYPETLEKVFIVNCTRVFTAVWKMAKHFFAEDVRNKIVILGGDYEKALDEFIAPDQRPSYLKGGRMHSDAEWTGDLKYMKNLGSKSIHEGLIKENIAAGKKLEQVITAQDGDMICWDFCTEKHNISFGIRAGTEWVLPAEKAECCNVLISDTFVVPRAGQYTVVFSNEYSKMNGKTVFYKLRVATEAGLASPLNA